MPSPPVELVSWLNAISPFATALVTVALVWFTGVLAAETRRMADAGRQPQVVVSLEPNDWAINHVDMKLANTGNASAFDVRVDFSPALVGSEISTERPLPFRHMSVLRPSQLFSGHISDHASLKDKTFTATVSWARAPKGKRESVSYDISLKDYEGLARLGGGDPQIQIAQHLKSIREDWRYVSSGNRRIYVETYDRADREIEEKEREERYRELRAKE